jgi:dihydroorotate dehydrogenase (NAD+) catalytic subunit
MVRTSVTIAGVEFTTRVFVASGTFGYGDEVVDLVDVNAIGGLITKSLSMKPRTGNPPPRIAETPSGMLNTIGLANIGVHRFITEKLPYLRKLSTKVIVNIAASSIEEYCAVLELLEREEGIAGYEINVSCPNVREGGMNFGIRCEMTAEITRRMRGLTKRLLIIKLTPNVTHISEFARACEAEGADALSVINTLVGMSVNISTREPRLSTITGGLSGPAIKPIALAKVYECVKSVKIPIIGIGGISDWKDAVEFLLVGASAVQIGTANFIDPAAAVTIARGIETYCRERSIPDVGDLVGGMKSGKEVSIVQSWL